MLSFSLITLGLATIVAYASPTIRAVGGLEVSLSTPADKVASVSDLRVLATVKNVGDEGLKVLKFGTVLDNRLPTRSFIVRKDGKEATFTGVKVSVSMTELSENDWVIIPAGKTVTAEHDVSAVYDFSATGPGTFTFDPISTFQVVGLDDLVETISDTVRIKATVARSVSITVTDDVAKRELILEKRAQVNCSTSSQASFISSSYTEGISLASQSSSYINSRGASDSVYKAYFGSNPTSSVVSKFNAVANDESNSRTLSCSDPYNVCDGGVVAYAVVPGPNIYFCSIFYDTLPSNSLCNGGRVNDRNVRGAVTVHELTHSVAETDDVNYGCPGNQDLSDSNKLINADNYGCFASQVYANTQC